MACVFACIQHVQTCAHVFMPVQSHMSQQVWASIYAQHPFLAYPGHAVVRQLPTSFVGLTEHRISFDLRHDDGMGLLVVVLL